MHFPASAVATTAARLPWYILEGVREGYIELESKLNTWLIIITQISETIKLISIKFGIVRTIYMYPTTLAYFNYILRL